MSESDLIWIVVFIVLLVGTFMSAWTFYKVIKQVEKENNKKKKE